MRFRNQGEDLVYCTPDETTLQNPEAIRTAAGLDVHLLYPMSGLETEEPILQPGRIDVLLGQGCLKFSRLEYILATKTFVDRRAVVAVDVDYGIVKNGSFPWIRAPIFADLDD